MLPILSRVTKPWLLTSWLGPGTRLPNSSFITEKIYFKSHKKVARILQVNFISFLEVEFPTTYLGKIALVEPSKKNKHKIWYHLEPSVVPYSMNEKLVENCFMLTTYRDIHIECSKQFK